MSHRVSRAIHFPQSFPNKSYASEGLLQFLPNDREAKDAAHYGLSVVCRCIMPSDESVHEYGARIAEKQNSNYEQREGHPPTDEARRVYLGYYDLGYERLSEVFLEYYDLAIRAVPEDGVWAHLEIHFVRNGVASDSPKRRRADRGAAISSIADRLRGPTLFPVAPADTDMRARQAELPTMVD